MVKSFIMDPLKNFEQRRRQPPRSGGGVRIDGGPKFFGATPFKTLGNAHFEDRKNTPF